MLPTSSSLLLTAALTVQGAPDTIPLFASDEPVEVTLEADFDAIRRDHSDDPEERPARVMLPGGDTLEAQLRPRGDFRRDPAYCSFPPLRLNLKKDGTDGTIFAGQDKLKVVVPCHPERDSYEEYVLREYLLYRVYSLVTDAAFRVRMARVTFADASGHDDPFTRWGFFIESDEALAARVGGQMLDIPEGKIVRADLLHPESSTRVAVFQYMIGNTDWADARVHNVAILAIAGVVVPVPYDFDFAGAVETPYAVPAPNTPIRSVRQRFYQGWCWPGLDTENVLQPFRDARARVESLYRDFPYLSEGTRDETLEYFGRFFDDIATADRAQRRMFRDCRKAG